jgi:uncharacterized membrane protein
MSMTCRIFSIALLVFLASACGRSEPTVSFSKDVRPALESRCGECHTPGNPGYEASQLSFASYESLMKGTQYGPVVIAGDSASSNLVVLIEGRADPSISMPHGDSEPLLQGEIDAIKLWIAQGAQNN